MPRRVGDKTAQPMLLARLAAVVMLLNGCVTTEPEVEEAPQEVRLVSYTFDQTPYAESTPPFPSKREADVVWNYSDGSKRVTSGYVGWDFNQDGYTDMVEVAGQFILYDFDGDGHVDAERDLAEDPPSLRFYPKLSGMNNTNKSSE